MSAKVTQVRLQSQSSQKAHTLPFKTFSQKQKKLVCPNSIISPTSSSFPDPSAFWKWIPWGQSTGDRTCLNGIKCGLNFSFMFPSFLGWVSRTVTVRAQAESCWHFPAVSQQLFLGTLIKKCHQYNRISHSRSFAMLWKRGPGYFLILHKEMTV